MLKLLIAEDENLGTEELLDFIIEKKLKCLKINMVGEASDGNNTLNLAKTSPEIILMDIKMPEMNGLECPKKISKILPRNSKTIILTAYDGILNFF